ALAPAERDRLAAALAKIDAALQQPASDPYNSALGLMTARASALEDAGLLEDAIATYDAIFSRWENAAWARHVAARLVRDADQRETEAQLAARGMRQRDSQTAP